MDNKLLELQKRVGKVSKDKNNPFFKSKYADINAYLDAVLPIASEVGLVITQPLSAQSSEAGGGTILRTQVMDGEKLVASCSVWLPQNDDPQKMGSIITYFRRYSLQSLLALQAEDDDGNKAVYTPPRTATQQPKVEPLYHGKPVEQPSTEGKNVCSVCNESGMADNVYKFSTEKLGKPICFPCQAKNKPGDNPPVQEPLPQDGINVGSIPF